MDDIREVFKAVAEARKLARAEERERIATLLEEEAGSMEDLDPHGADDDAASLRRMAKIIRNLKD